jgi:hypothetical protein
LGRTGTIADVDNVCEAALREHLHLPFNDRGPHRHLVELQTAVEQVDVRDRDALRIFGGSCLKFRSNNQMQRLSDCKMRPTTLEG